MAGIVTSTIARSVTQTSNGPAVPLGEWLKQKMLQVVGPYEKPLLITSSLLLNAAISKASQLSAA